MNAAHFHLMFNHLPIVGLGFAMLLHLIAIIRKNYELINLSCWFYILVGLLSVLPIITGDGAGEILLNIAMLIVAFALIFFAYQAGTTGGSLRHPEIEQVNFTK